MQPDFSYDPFGKFPYRTSATGEELRFENSEQIWSVISSWGFDSVELYHAALLIASPSRLLDPWAIDMIYQYNYCKDYSIPAYPGSYQEQPAHWVEASNIIKSEMATAQRFKNGNN